MFYVWLGAFALFLLIEAVTPAFVSLWFAGGALVSLILSLFVPQIWIQVLVFIVASFLLLIFTRPLYNKYIKTRITPTNLDALIGQVAVVTEKIDNIAYTGAAKIRGQVWSAKTDDGSVAEAGEELYVKEISGVNLILTKNHE